eukprot:scaffold14098_cov157-Skeletonema_marinoi.AAC.4
MEEEEAVARSAFTGYKSEDEPELPPPADEANANASSKEPRRRITESNWCLKSSWQRRSSWHLKSNLLSRSKRQSCLH